MLFSILLSISFVFADCEIPEPSQPLEKGACPIGLSHLDQIQEFYNCRRPTGKPRSKTSKSVNECQGKAKAFLSAFPFIAAASFALMSPQERAAALAEFANEDLGNIADKVAELEFEKDYKKPADRKLLVSLKKKGKRLQIQAKMNVKGAKEKWEAFQKDEFNRHYIKALKKNKWNINKVNEPVFRDVIGGRRIDIANTKFSDLPKNLVHSKRHPNTLIKQKYMEHAKKAVEGIRNELRKGKAFGDIRRIPGVTKSDLKTALREFEKGATSFRHKKFMDKLTPSMLKKVNDRIKERKKLKAQGLIKEGKWTKAFKTVGKGGVVGLGLQAMLLPAKKEEDCDNSFPHYPVEYKPSSVVGLPAEMNCSMVMPSLSQKAPGEVSEFLNLSPQEKAEALSGIGTEDTGSRYVCNYYRRLYNHLFCNGNKSPGSGVKTEK